MMELEDLVQLKRSHPRTSFVFIFHSTKQGQFRGGNALAHEVDVIFEVEPGLVKASGRFKAQVCSGYSIYFVMFEKKTPMRQVFFLLSVALFAIGCNDASVADGSQGESVEQEVSLASEEDLVRKAIEAVLVQELNDPASFEFVSMSKGRVTTLGENIDFRRKQFERDVEENAEFLAALDSLEKFYANELGSIRATDWVFKFRGTNSFGAKVLSEYIVQVGPEPNYEILQIVDDPSKRYLNPNDIPGWKELAVKIIANQ